MSNDQVSELAKWAMTIAAQSAATGESVLATARKTKRTRRKTITVRGEVRS